MLSYPSESAKLAGNTLLVVSIPASQNEIGGEGGQAALERPKNVLERNHRTALGMPEAPCSAGPRCLLRITRHRRSNKPQLRTVRYISNALFIQDHYC
jgi:hypothetical protein